MLQSGPSRKHAVPIQTREELLYLLSRASELEHGLACVYLFAAYSLKGEASEGGLTEEEAVVVRGWKRKLASVAVEEMLHLAQVTNLITAIGGAPHMRRPNFPLPATAFPFGIELTLEPFSKGIIERLVCYEMPEAGVLSTERQLEFDALRARVGSVPHIAAQKRVRRLMEPFDIDFQTVGEFYHKIELGFRSIPEQQLFIGPADAQAKPTYLDLDGALRPVTDRASACAAIEMIVEQGENPTSAHPDAHFSVFDAIRVQYDELVAAAAREGRAFDPVRPVVSNPMARSYDDATGGTIITDHAALEVADLFNVTYDTMLLMLLRFFAHGGENADELRLLARGTLRMMASVLRPLGEALTKMPAGAAFPGKTAGPGFGYNADIDLLPHKESAWVFFLERLRQLVKRTSALAATGRYPHELSEAAAALQSVTEHLEPLLPKAYAHKTLLPPVTHGRGPTISCERDGPYLVANVRSLTNSRGETLPARPALALCRCGGSNLKPYCDGTHARNGFTSEKDPERMADRLDTYVGREITVYDNRGTCCHSGNCTDRLPSAFRAHDEPFVNVDGASAEEIISIVRACPSGALGYASHGERYRGEPRDPAVFVSHDGPYHITGGIALEDVERNAGASTEHYALCRCGHSKNKPFCDGTHWYVKFEDEDN